MDADDCDGLPMYFEEDEEEAAAEKQKRRQQSRKPVAKLPWEPATPEEKAKRELNFAMMDKLHEYDPKLGYGCYTRVWFVDFSTFDIDEETQYGPMRYTDSLIGDDHELTDSFNVLCLKIMSSDVGYPINVYGTVIVRDRLDMKCIYVFQRNSDNCQLVQSEGESLILTGPSRGVVFHSDAYFEINLKIKGDREIMDKQFSKALIDVDISKFDSMVKRKTVVSWLSEVDLILAYVKNALEGTIEIRILSGPEAFYGKITVCTCTTDVSHILLYDSDVNGANTLSSDRVIQLLRRVVAVSVDQMLIFHIYARSDDQNANTSHCIRELRPLIKGADKIDITCGVYKLRVEVTWSTLLVE
ncbi:hypothetical protein ACP70R_036260 [Stipagrostis hirtigluma subsp. patula]